MPAYGMMQISATRVRSPIPGGHPWGHPPGISPHWSQRSFMSTLQFATHKVTKGGSCATSSNLIRGTYRQAYLPFRSDVYTGFRTCAA